MTKLSTAQLKTANVLITKLGITKEQKADIVAGFTGGRSTSSKDLSSAEAVQLIGHLKSMDPDEKRAERMRKKIISMAHDLGWHLPRSRKIDMPRLDGWCKEYGYGKKGLNSYTLAELPKLVAQFELGPYRHALRHP